MALFLVHWADVGAASFPRTGDAAAEVPRLKKLAAGESGVERVRT
jgi:hypothetical protein